MGRGWDLTMGRGWDLTMAALLGKLDQFNPEQEEWPQYVEHLDQFFEANELAK